MKRFGNLFERICTFKNFVEAFYKARKGKGNAPNVVAFEVDLEHHLFTLLEELKNGEYSPGGYNTFMIYDPKVRMISAAPFRDRVVHHALCNVIEPIFDQTFIGDSYANRKNKGTHAAIRKCQSFVRKYPYGLKGDIRKYFPSIDHVILKDLIRRKIKCRPTLNLIDRIIDNSNPQDPVLDYHSGDNLFTIIDRRKGLPMGNLTSQFFANVYLSPFDHFVKEDLRIPGYVRYVDDFVLFHSDKEFLHKCRKEISDYLSRKLRLNVHERKTSVFGTSSGLTFLGQRIFSEYRRIKRSNVSSFRKRLRNRLELYRDRKITPLKFECQLNSWLGHAKQADTWKLRKQIFNYLRHKEGLNLFETDRFAWRLLEQ